jgi:hypothetical protein
VVSFHCEECERAADVFGNERKGGGQVSQADRIACHVRSRRERLARVVPELQTDKVATMKAAILVLPAVSIVWLLALGGCGDHPADPLPAGRAGSATSSTSNAAPTNPVSRSADPVDAHALPWASSQPGISSTAVAADSSADLPAEMPRDDAAYAADGTPPTPAARWDAAAPGTPAHYERAVKQCDALSGNEKTVCMNMADSARANR